eukprot:COSAG05_NODE_2895_length_2530_cov_2.067873_4_plen_113_part_00
MVYAVHAITAHAHVTFVLRAALQALGVPVFSSSSLRWCAGAQAVRSGSIGAVAGADCYGPAHYEEEHRGMPDFFWCACMRPFRAHATRNLCICTVFSVSCIGVRLYFPVILR